MTAVHLFLMCLKPKRATTLRWAYFESLLYIWIDSTITIIKFQKQKKYRIRNSLKELLWREPTLTKQSAGRKEWAAREKTKQNRQERFVSRACPSAHVSCQDWWHFPCLVLQSIFLLLAAPFVTFCFKTSEAEPIFRAGHFFVQP